MEILCKTHQILLLLFIVLTISYLHRPTVQAFKAPFHPRDVLPWLPGKVSWPILGTLNNAADLLPSFVGAAFAANNSLNWKGSCFYNNSAWMEFHNKSSTEFGGGTLHIKVIEVITIAAIWVTTMTLLRGYIAVQHQDSGTPIMKSRGAMMRFNKLRPA